jgi:preprotein translocase subunit YajC
MKKGDKVTFLGMPAEIAKIDDLEITYLLGTKKVEVTVKRHKEATDRSPSRALPGT